VSFFLVGANTTIAAGLFFGLLLAHLGHLSPFSGIIQEHDVVRVVLVSAPVILICMGLHAVLNRLAISKTK